MVIKIGDIHRKWNVLGKILRELPLGCTVIQVGDFGVGLRGLNGDEDNMLNILKKDLEEMDQVLYVVRGNHDNPSYFKGQYVEGRIKFVPDYHVETIEDKNYLFLGGAVSVDRSILVEGWDWFKDEPFHLDWARLKEFRNINVVISHNAPQFCYPQTKGNLVHQYHHGMKSLGYPGDPELLTDVSRERMFLTAAYQELMRNNTLDAWYYGHYHKSNTEYIDNVKFKLLDINEAVE